MFWPQVKDPDVVDRYGFDMDTDWLDGETITNVTFTASVDSGLTIDNISYVESPRISAQFSGGNDGFWPIKIRIETATRQYEECTTLWVKQGC
ncbi:hypothetical protein Barba19A_gp141 [Rheinheimera phage vB_RspM_Barba19A]|uniref:Virion associated protein n=1 Tax=Rheinheimera phage vB_RspM_Barba19A TaxID=2565658 RepID=A0A4P8N4W0_9CAUD|nr:hypothetical protein HOV47_gp141 [Rheinheimera phage vB_RspM_Barba19A]QCQ61981.1 hypothetical protein Barba19A_gp141 [Rheinheimera phage vB_RspM_Barba19A]